MATTRIDPLAQSFILDSTNFPNGAFLSSINLFFRSKPSTNIPVKLFLIPTQNGFPYGNSLNYSFVSLTPDLVNTSESPNYKDSTTYTNFKFSAPVYVNPDVLYAMVIQSESSDYVLWCASQSDNALPSSAKENPTDANPSNPTKIVTSPSVGSLFESQNALTWAPDLTRDLMFTINRCVFNTSANPNLSFVVPAGLPKRKYVDWPQSVTKNFTYDAFNVSVTDFIPPSTSLNYSYTSTLNSTGLADGPYTLIPGKFGTPLPDNKYLDDNKGQRVLQYTSNSSFILSASLVSSSDAVSPMISDDGTNLYTVRYRINNMSLSNSNISLLSGGGGYLSGASGTLTTPNISISAPDTSSGVQAFAAANVVNGNIVSIYITTAGSGYIKTPTLSILGTNTVQASAVVVGETSATGGNGSARYITKPTSLATGNDSGDLRVYMTAYRPVNTGIYVYYRIIAREDTQAIATSNWQLMTLINGGESKYSSNRNELIEFVAAPGINNVANNFVKYTSTTTSISYTRFYQYQIKIVLASSDSTFSPYLADMRVIALPSGNGL
jgi:hypothetical protein